MKVDKFILEDNDKLQVKQEIQVESKKLLDRITPYKGHTMFEINVSTGEIIKAKYEEINVSFESKAVKKKILVNDNCLYVSCLNLENARKKYVKYLMFNIKIQNERIK